MAYSYQTTRELQRIAQILLPRLTANRIVFADDFFPIRNVDSHALEWSQLDDVLGLQQARGLNGRPARIQRLGGKRFMLEPGVYGEFGVVDEREITTRRPWGASPEVTIDIGDLVSEVQAQLLQRRLDRQEWIVWTLLTTGAVNVPAPDGAVVYSDQYTFQTFAAGVPWATSATATPLADFRSVALKARGYSVSFNQNAKAYMNQVTYNSLLTNGNSTDLFGRRTDGLATINSPDQLNALLLGDGLPSPAVYDEGYKDEAGVFQQFIPNNKVVVIGNRRDGQPVGEYRMTRNANNPGAAPGAYMKVVDDPDEVPRTVAIHDGHSGGPCVFFPSAICVMTV